VRLADPGDSAPDTACLWDLHLDAVRLWAALQEVVSDSLWVRPDEVTKDAWLKRDLGMD
jgi:hypothetical protein